MDNCQPQQAIEPGRKVPETNGEEANPEESHVDNVCKEEEGQGSSSSSLIGHQMGKGIMYLHQQVEKKIYRKD